MKTKSRKVLSSARNLWITYRRSTKGKSSTGGENTRWGVSTRTAWKFDDKSSLWKICMKTFLNENSIVDVKDFFVGF